MEKSCGICLIDFVPEDNLKVLNCQKPKTNHVFHAACIIEWFQKKKECPLCRTDFEPLFNQVGVTQATQHSIEDEDGIGDEHEERNNEIKFEN